MIGILLTLFTFLALALAALGVRQASEQALRSHVRVRVGRGVSERMVEE